MVTKMNHTISSFALASIFSSHCVLQQKKVLCIFGTGQDECEVRVSLKDKNQRLLFTGKTKIFNGKWRIYTVPLSAQEEVSLTAECKETKVTLTDIAIGEVFLAGGQSNMEFELGNCTEGKAELENDLAPNVRFYYTQKIAWKDEAFFAKEKETAWELSTSSTKTHWSAVGYFFAKELSQRLGVTVGIIGCNWGGTSASAWMAKSRLEKDEDLLSYLSDYQKATEGKSVEEQCKEYDDYVIANDSWQKKCEQLYKENPQIEWDEVQKRIGKCLWPGPMGCKNPYRPAGLYECMIERIVPYTIKGFLYYQGESDDHKAHLYYKLFRELIDQWRSDWNDDTLPFVFVQLPEHRYRQDKDFKNWPLIRDAQRKISQTVKGAFMTCALGLGEYDDIHPKHKKELALRMAKTALANIYGLLKKEEVESPLLQAQCPCENKIILYFDNAESGLVLKTDSLRLERYRTLEARQKQTVSSDFSSFEIAGSDKVFYPAQASVKGNTLTLTCAQVAFPLYARYAWYNYGPVTLFNNWGLPASPFNTAH